VLFYAWPHGATLSDDPARVTEITREKVRRLREVEDFAGTLEAWKERTSPVSRLRLGPEDIVLDGNIYFYYLGALSRPAVTNRVQIRITRTAPDGVERLDLVTTDEAQMNRSAQAGGMLFPMGGLVAGEHRIRFELLDRDRTAAAGDLWLEYRPGVTDAPDPGAASPTPG